MTPAIQRILVICQGNHCRSPMAEAELAHALGSAFSVASAGLGALVDHPAHEDAQRVMAARGLDISGHLGRQFTSELALDADLILVMDEDQKAACERQVPSLRGRVFLLGHWLPPGEREIDDPIHDGLEGHQRALQHIQRALPPWLSRLAPRYP